MDIVNIKHKKENVNKYRRLREQSRFRPAVHNPQYFGWLAKHYELLDGTSNLFIKPSTVRHDHLRATADRPQLR